MASKLNTLEGVTLTNTITAANSGGASGDAWNSTSSTGATLISDNTHFPHGTRSAKIATTSSAQSFMTWTLTASGTWFFRVYFWVDTITAATNPSIMRFRGTTDTVQCIRVTFDDTGHLQLRNTGNSLISTMTAAFTLSAWNRVEGFCTPGATTTSGAAELKLFVADNSTPVTNGTLTTSGQNMGSVTNVDACAFGQVVAFTNLPAEWMADFAVSNVAYIGPQVVTLSPASIATAESFGPATETPGKVTLSPASIASAQSFGTVTETPGRVTLSPLSIASAEAFATPVETPGRVTLSPASVASLESFGVPASQPGTVNLSPASIGSLEAFGTPFSLPGAVILNPPSIGSEEDVPTPATNAVATITLFPPSIESKERFGPVVAARITPSSGACCDGMEFRQACCLDSVPEED